MSVFENYDEALRASLKNSNLYTLEGVLKDDVIFKDTLLKVAAIKPNFMEEALRNASADKITAYVSEKTIDYIIAKRFKTIPAKTLLK